MQTENYQEWVYAFPYLLSQIGIPWSQLALVWMSDLKSPLSRTLKRALK